MSQTQVRQCKCSAKKFVEGKWENEKPMFICKNCFKDPEISISGKFTDIDTGKEVN